MKSYKGYIITAYDTTDAFSFTIRTKTGKIVYEKDGFKSEEEAIEAGVQTVDKNAK